MSEPQNISYHRFWRGMVEAAKHLVIEELKPFDISQKPVVDDVKIWIRHVVSELTLWQQMQNRRTKADVAEKIDQLRALPAKMAMARKSKEAKASVFWEATSVSLLRLRPFRRTMLWDLCSNLLLPLDYIKDRIEKTEASLTSGETAFAAFAASCSYSEQGMGYRQGMVVGDCRENLRGTYFLIDRTLGLRSNVAVPMRKLTDEEDQAASPILAMFVVSLPFASAFRPDFTRRLAQKLNNYEGYVDLMWEYEQLRERDEFEDKPCPKDDIDSIIDDLTPDAETSDRDSVLPGCAIVVGDAKGSGQMAAAVQLNELHVAVSPRHQSVFAQSELELEAYGVSDRCISLADFVNLGGTSGFHLMAQLVEQRPFETLPTNMARVIKTIGDVSNKSFVRGGKASLSHRKRETQRGLFGYLLDYLVSGEKQYRKKLVDDLRYSQAPKKSKFDFRAFGSALDLLEEWARTQRELWKYLSLCTAKQVLALTYEASAMTYLAGFEAEMLPSKTSFLLSERMAKTADEDLRNSAIELGGPRRFIAWCRALNALTQTLPRLDGIQKFNVKDFGIYRGNAQRDLICYLPSMLLPNGAKIRIIQTGKTTDIDIQCCSGKWVLKSSWHRWLTKLPLATAACSPLRNPVTELGPNGSVRFTPIKLRGLASKKALFFDLRHLHAATKQRNWRFDPEISPSLKPIAKLVSALAGQLPEWVTSMDCLAIVPMPFSDALEIPTLSQWCQGAGRRQPLVAGILRRSLEEDVWGEWDIELMNGNLNDDPFIERFQQLLGVMQRRQSTRRAIEASTQSHFLFTHLSHDVCSQDKINTLREVLSTQAHYALNRKERHSLRGAELIVDDLDQLRLLSSEIEPIPISFAPALEEISGYVKQASESALIHGARKISRGSRKRVSPEDLRRFLNIKHMAQPDHQVTGRESHPVAVLLDNVIRNALEGAWNHDRHFGKGTARVCIQARPVDGCLVIANDAEPGQWSQIQQIYQDEDRRNTGITVIRLVAKLLKIECVVHIVSETRGEIQLITERRLDANSTGGQQDRFEAVNRRSARHRNSQK